MKPVLRQAAPTVQPATVNRIARGMRPGRAALTTALLVVIVSGCTMRDPSTTAGVGADDDATGNVIASGDARPAAAPPTPAPAMEAKLAHRPMGRISGLLNSGIKAHEPIGPVAQERERYAHATRNPVHVTAETPVSTFSIDVDTASYANVRRFLNQGRLPHQDAVRVEEMINYFAYGYAPPATRGEPFAVHTETAPSPWHPDRQLLHIGVKGFEKPSDQLPPANLVFLVDVSGSMQSPAKLPLLKASLKLLVQQMRPTDRIAIAVYAGAAGTVLEPTLGSDRAKIIAALDRLEAGGSTNGGAGIRLAYQLANAQRVDAGINRVILATDGDFNVGTVNTEALKQLVEAQRKQGVALTILGFGAGNYNDALMQELAQIGDGNAAYVDTLNEARKVLVDEMASTLDTIARDVKIQVEFNPRLVAEYRLIGYESRLLNREDFNNDRVDAGDIGPGHTVTALYEIVLVGAASQQIDPPRYAKIAAASGEARDATEHELAFVKLRFKKPDDTQSERRSYVVDQRESQPTLASTSESFRFSAAVAAFGQLLTGGIHTDDFGFADVIVLANGAKGSDPFGIRHEFVGLVRTADALAPNPAPAKVSALQ